MIKKINGVIFDFDDDLENWGSSERRPYYRLRGKSITEEQAMEVIRRTDDFFDFEVGWHFDINADCCDMVEKGYLGVWHLRNIWFNKNHTPRYMGWVHADGTVGANGITDRYPEMDEFTRELSNLINEFPFLDFVLVITYWNEMPDEFWRADLKDEEMKYKLTWDMFDGFEDAIDIGFWVHDGMVDVLNDRKAYRRYKEYDKKYSVEDPKFYCSWYCQKNNLQPCSLDYLRKCIEAYGLNPDEVFSKIACYVLDFENRRWDA